MGENMSKGKVIVLCGKIASGKTYYANQIKEKENAIIFSVDELTYYMFDNRSGEDYTDLTKRAIRYFQEKTVDIVNKGVNVILDLGLWSSKERKEIREFFISKGINIKIHYIDIDDKSGENNIKVRNKRIDEGNRGMDFYVKDSLKEKVLSIWEEPTEDEIDVWYKFKNDERRAI
jgi:predicted kinase